MIIDSDTWPGGVPGLGATKVHRQLAHMKGVSPTKTLDEDLVFNGMLKWAVDTAHYQKGTPAKCRFSEEPIRILVDAIIYEPVNRRVTNLYENDGTSLSNPKSPF